MSMKLNHASFVALVDEAIAWVLKQPRTLERDHVIQCLEFAKTPEAYDLAASQWRPEGWTAQPDGTEKGPNR